MLSLRNKLFIFLVVLLLLNLSAFVFAYYQYQSGLLPSFTLKFLDWQWVLNPALFFLTKIGLSITLLFVGALLVFHYLTAPLKYKIKQLQESVDKIAQEDYRPIYEFTAQDEFSQLGEAFNRIMQTLADKQIHYQAMSQLLSPILVQESISQNLKKTLHRKMSLLTLKVVDIDRYYTQLPAKRLLYLLNNYFTRVNYCIENQQGITLHYTGNHLISVYGLQQAPSQHQYQVMLASIQILNAVTLFNIEEGKRNKVTFSVNIGISSGKMIAGNIGAYNYHQYSLIGEALNLSASLQQLCQRYGVSILLDQTMMNSLTHQPKGHHKTPLLFRQLDVVKLNKQVTHLELYELLQTENQPEQLDNYLQRYAQAFDLLHQQQFDNALILLESLAQDWSQDVPTRLLLKRCQHYADDAFAYDYEHFQGAYILGDRR